MISSKEAVQKVIEEALKFRHIHVLLKIEEAIGHRMASDLKSICHSPPFDQSAMDGYAFRLCDIQSNEAIQISKDENSAGKSKIKHIKPHTAIRIFTGAKIPSNADVVIPQELVEIDEKGNLQFNRSKFKALDNIRTKGSQFKKGDVIIKKGELLNAPRIAIAATGGHSKIKVFRFPTASITVSGNELVKPGTPLKSDMIYESNSIMLHAILSEYKIQVHGVFRSEDKIASLKKCISNCLKTSDIVLISGGISVGKYDLVKDVLNELKVKTVFHKVKQKPGKPLYFGTIGKKFVFGLPGNPAASLTCFYEYVIPLIKTLQGDKEPLRIIKKARLGNSYSKKSGLTHFLKGYVNEKSANILSDQESYKLTSFAEANCLIIIPENETELKAGDLVDYHSI
ncbi:MAG: molybdopterin molybdotransferase MoeA [Bacteroidia bacterium]|jgi:molybdopterin molybdotransferase|nr:molybdopterin molybdotransferase MoeA [Sphingobacteriaceae bacterium]MBP9082329.1 molybdopterin molybdotransferase MoeA [Bacteroidia bacterium]